MEARPPQQTTTEHLVDDPSAPTRLPPLAQISDFWRRYDRLADIHDKKLTSNLNGNLDVLLIFAALFSAINTTFISITMPGLSPNPSDETNTLLRLLVMRADNSSITPADLSPPFSPNSTSVVVNCLLYASLSCSLLAAVGAMMAKEWLQSFDRTGQTGPSDEQGRFRQLKFNGVEQWHLEAVIKFLPNLLLLSVFFFFIGIGIFLTPINAAVAGIVIAFLVVGGTLSSAVIVSGAISPLCPYQSAASRALRRAAGGFDKRRMTLSLSSISSTIRGAFTQPQQLWERVLQLGPKLQRMGFPVIGRRNGATPETQTEEDNEQIVSAKAARWLLETTSNRGDQLAAAQFIRTLDRNACAPAFENSRAFLRLLSLTCEALDAWDFQPNPRDQEVAELFGLALCHVPLEFPENVNRNTRSDEESSFSMTFLQALGLARANLLSKRPEDNTCILHIAFLSTIISRGLVIEEYQWVKLSQLLWVDETLAAADALLGLWAIYVGQIGQDQTVFSHELEDLLDVEKNEERLLQYLPDALLYSDQSMVRAQEYPQSELDAAQCFRVCLRRAAELSSKASPEQLGWEARGMADLARNYLDAVITSDTENSNLKWVRFSIEVVLGLHAFIDESGDSNEFSISRDSQLERSFNHRFINAVADILLDEVTQRFSGNLSTVAFTLFHPARTARPISCQLQA